MEAVYLQMCKQLETLEPGPLLDEVAPQLATALFKNPDLNSAVWKELSKKRAQASASGVFGASSFGVLPPAAASVPVPPSRVQETKPQTEDDPFLPGPIIPAFRSRGALMPRCPCERSIEGLQEHLSIGIESFSARVRNMLSTRPWSPSHCDHQHRCTTIFAWTVLLAKILSLCCKRDVKSRDIGPQALGILVQEGWLSWKETKMQIRRVERNTAPQQPPCSNPFEKRPPARPEWNYAAYHLEDGKEVNFITLGAFCATFLSKQIGHWLPPAAQAMALPIRDKDEETVIHTRESGFSRHSHGATAILAVTWIASSAARR